MKNAVGQAAGPRGGPVSRRGFVLGSLGTAVLVHAAVRDGSGRDSGTLSAKDERTLLRVGELALLTTMGQEFAKVPARIHIGGDARRLHNIVTALHESEAERVAAGTTWFREHMTLRDSGAFLREVSRFAAVTDVVRSSIDLAAATAISGVGTKFSPEVDPAVGRLWVDGLLMQGGRHRVAV